MLQISGANRNLGPELQLWTRLVSYGHEKNPDLTCLLLSFDATRQKDFLPAKYIINTMSPYFLVSNFVHIPTYLLSKQLYLCEAIEPC